MKNKKVISSSGILRMVEESPDIQKIRKVKKDTDELQDTIDKYDEFQTEKFKLESSLELKKKAPYFAGYRPKFYFRTSDVKDIVLFKDKISDSADKIVKLDIGE